MAQLYKYYQKVGGTEPWKLARADENLESETPTFVTILNLDTLGTLPSDSPTRELLDSVKYFGPLYFDLDSKDLQESIDAANELVEMLQEEGLEESDLEIFLSGKKGLHILVSPLVFMERQQPVQFLPSIYKEVAFKLSVPTLDYRVYTARSGRMLRTCCNVRENGNFRVPVTLSELKRLTVEKYNEYCSAPRTVPTGLPEFRPRLALVYDAAKQKISKVSRKKRKPVDAQTLQKHLPVIQQLMSGNAAPGVGFNKLALQLAIYAREAGVTPDMLVTLCAGLVNSHCSDGDRYNTPSRREEELRRMCDYVDGSTCYEYALGPIKALLPRAISSDEASEDGEPTEESIAQDPKFMGISAVGTVYVVSKGEAGDAAISNFIFTEIVKLLSPEDGAILGLRAVMHGLGEDTPSLIFQPSQFTGSSGLQNAVSKYGGSFTGSDVHARGIYQIMLHRAGESRYIVDSEGVNVINVPTAENLQLREKFVIWADGAGVRVPPWVEESGVKFDFSGHPEPLGVIKTDLTLSPTLESFAAESPENKELVKVTMKALFNCQSHDTVGKMLGWMAATFWRQPMHCAHKKFPLLHVYGPAGLGKTELTKSLLRMFFYKAEPITVTPTSTPYGLQGFVGGSGSVPVFMDEYKPAKMNSENLEKYRAIFRDAYNMTETTRGGGSRSKEAYNALNRVTLTGPIVFAAEAPETENAIIERVVLVSIRKPTASRLSSNFANFRVFGKGLDVITAIGHSLATAAVKDGDMVAFVRQFDKIHDKALERFMIQPQDYEMLAKREISQSDFDAKSNIKPRTVFNSSVALFGLLKVKALLKILFEDEFDEIFGADFAAMQAGVFAGLNDMAASTVPEYIKLLTTMGDMTQLAPDDRMRMQEGLEYNISEIGGRPVLALVARAAYTKYRTYCRQSGMEFYYPNEHSFTQAIKEIPQFLKSGKGTVRAQVETLIFDMEDLYRAGVSRWTGRPVALPV